MKYSVMALLSLVWLASCAPSGEKVEIQNLSIDVVATGPLFEGPNTATFDWDVNLESYLGKATEAITSAQIKAVRIKAKGSDLDAIAQDFTLQLAANGVDMAKVAHASQAEPNEAFTNLQVAEKQEKLEKFFNQEKITFVLDFDYLEEETYDDIEFSIEVDLEMTVK